MIDAHLLTSGIIFGLSMGSIFFLMTVGLSLCFGMMRVISLDQLLYYSLGSLVYAPLAQMAPFVVMLLILLVRPTGLFGSPLLKR